MGSDKRRRRDIRACTECKQSKVRCDALETFPEPCSRCANRGAECAVDASFKRTPARQRIKAMADELRQLKTAKTLEEGPISGQFTDMDDHSPWQYSNGNSEDNSVNLASGLSGTAWEASVEPLSLCTSPRSSGYSITLSTEEIIERFKIFRQHFHPHMPIVSTATPIHALQKHSPFLFWTIIIVTFRFQDYHSRTSVEADYLQLLSKTSTDSPLSLHSIQALVLICTWPLQQNSQFEDPSWLYCNLAIGASGYLNLNRPVNHVDRWRYHGGQLSDADLDNMCRTWLAVFVISTAVAIGWGITPVIKHTADLTTIDALVAQASVPRILAVKASIMAIIARHYSLTEHDTNTITYESLVDLHIREIDVLVERFSDIWNDEMDFLAHSAKLHVTSSLLIADIKRKQPRSHSYQLRQGTVFAQEVIHLFQAIVGSGMNLDGQSSSLKFATVPKKYFLQLVSSTFFLIRFSCFNPSLRESDRQQSRDAVGTARITLERCSTHSGGPNVGDEPVKAAVVIDLLLKHGDIATEQLNIDDRGSGSLFWDSLRRANLIRGRFSNNDRTDLQRLIDPTKATGATTAPPVTENMNGNAAIPLQPMQNNESNDTLFAANIAAGQGWNDPLMQFFDLNWLDVPDLAPDSLAIC